MYVFITFTLVCGRLVVGFKYDLFSSSSSTLTTSSIFVHSFFAVYFFIIGHGFHSLPQTTQSTTV